DQSINPTYAADLATAAIALASADTQGVVHVVSAGCSTWHEFARATLDAFGVAGEVEPVASAELGAAAPRPPNGCLESSRTQALRQWREGLLAWAEKRKVTDAKRP
ncbi:MAG TPA: sugar nucleotide-binding protein, partial [Dehalococcoidia bacterium]|nr:sugar nucleotide-binding protein [Dehalococcoidia bacterium]